MGREFPPNPLEDTGHTLRAVSRPLDQRVTAGEIADIRATRFRDSWD